MKSIKAKVAKRGRVTILKRLRDSLGIKPGTTLEFSEERGCLVAIKSATRDPISRVYGCLGGKFSTDTVMTLIRGVRD